MKMNVRIAQQRVKDMFSLIFTAHFESMHRIYCEWMSPCTTHLTTGGFENCLNIYCPQIYILYHRISYSILNGITDKHSLIWYDIISNLDSLLNLNFCAKNQIRFLRSQNFPQSLVPFPFLHYTLTSSPSHCEHWTLCPEEPLEELSFHLVTL